jgi:lipopolysaccharide export system ATP-binding protein
MSELQAQHLVKRFKTRTVVNDVNLSIKSGEIVGLLGPNGAGKTTCFYIIVGLLSCNSGNVLLDETDITNLPLHARAHAGIGYLPQEASIFRKLTVEQNILAVLELRKNLTKKERLIHCEKLLDEFHIQHLRSHLGLSLSGGERRRVEIARTLAMEPAFILLDEPFAGIDPISVVDIKRIITHLSERHIGILITDHNVRETLDICQRGYIVSEGKVICQGTPQEILANEQVREVYLGEDFNL